MLNLAFPQRRYFSVNSMAVATVKYAGGDVITLGIVSAGILGKWENFDFFRKNFSNLVAIMFAMAWFQGEDGVIRRIIDKAEDAVRKFSGKKIFL